MPGVTNMEIKMFMDWLKWFGGRNESTLIFLFAASVALSATVAINDAARVMIVVANIAMLLAALFSIFRCGTKRAAMDRPMITVESVQFISSSEPEHGRRDVTAEVTLWGNKRHFICTIHTAKLGNFTQNDMAKAFESISSINQRGGSIHESWNEWNVPSDANSIYGRMESRLCREEERLESKIAKEFAV